MPWSLTNPCDYNYKGIKSVIEFFFNCSTTEVDAITIHFFNEWRKSICLSPLKILMALSLQENTQVVGYRRNFWLILNVINDIFIGTKYSPFRQSQTDTKYMNPLSQCSNIFRIARLENSNVTRQNHTGFRASPLTASLHSPREWTHGEKNRSGRSRVVVTYNWKLF